MNQKRYPLVNKETFELVQWILDPKVIDGALRSAIHAHGMIAPRSGPIFILEQDVKGFWSISQVTTCSTSSASKRIRGAVRTRIIEHLDAKQKELDKVKPKWYSRIVRLGRQAS